MVVNRDVIRNLQVASMVLILGVAAVIYGFNLAPRRVECASKCSNVLEPSGGRVHSLAQGSGSPVKALGIRFIAPSRRGRKEKSSSRVLFNAVKNCGFLRAYALPPDCFSFEPSGKPVFTGYPPTPGQPRPVEIIRRVPWAKKKVALTFDTGTVREPGTSALVEELANLRAPATFFVCGAWCSQNSDTLKSIVNMGFEVASHSNTHPWFTRLSDQEIVAELKNAEAAFTNITGKPIGGYFRPPFGDHDARVRNLVSQYGYLTVMWSRDTRDWKRSVPPETVISNAVSWTKDGDIILMHTLGKHTASVLPRIVKTLRDKGFELTTVSGLLQK